MEANSSTKTIKDSSVLEAVFVRDVDNYIEAQTIANYNQSLLLPVWAEPKSTCWVVALYQACLYHELNQQCGSALLCGLVQHRNLPMQNTRRVRVTTPCRCHLSLEVFGIVVHIRIVTQ